MKNTFWKRERIEIMIALALFNYVFLGAEYLFDNMMTFRTDSSGVVLAQSYVLGISTIGFLLFGVFRVSDKVQALTDTILNQGDLLFRRFWLKCLPSVNQGHVR